MPRVIAHPPPPSPATIAQTPPAHVRPAPARNEVASPELAATGFERTKGQPASALVGAPPTVGREDWLKGAVIYGVVPPLFGEQPFNAVTERLDYLKALGVDAIWLSPINETDDPSTISYAVTDYKNVRADFGTREEFKKLVDAAHARGLKVLMDFVPNHTSIEHPFFKDALRKGEASEYWDYYVRDANGEPQHYFDWEPLKNLNFDNPGVQKMMIDAFTYWVRDMGVDGFRVDAAWGVKDRNPEFWSRMEKALSEVNPDVFLLAEASARDPYYVKNGFDAAYDWSKDLGKWNWEHAFADANKVGDELRKALKGRETPPDQIARFLNNNDTGERFITRYGVERQRVAAVLMHALPGIPVVYTGDEIGAEFEPYEDPPPISWDDPHNLRPLYQKLAELRETSAALRDGSFTEVKVKNAPGVYAFMRDAGGDDQALVVLNFGKATKVEVELPRVLRDDAKDGVLHDVLAARDFKVKAGRTTMSVDLKKASAVILTP